MVAIIALMVKMESPVHLIRMNLPMIREVPVQ